MRWFRHAESLDRPTKWRGSWHGHPCAQSGSRSSLFNDKLPAAVSSHCLVPAPGPCLQRSLWTLRAWEAPSVSMQGTMTRRDKCSVYQILSEGKVVLVYMAIIGRAEGGALAG